MSDPVLTDLLDRLRNRFYGKYRGSVTEVDAKSMRVRAKVPAVLGEQSSGWCLPCVPYAGPKVGMAFLPEVGSGVWIEFEGGDVSYPIWVGCYWRDGEVPPDAAAKVKILATKNATLKLDDDAGTITLSDGHENKIVLADAGISVERGSGKVEVADGKVSVNDGALEVS